MGLDRVNQWLTLVSNLAVLAGFILVALQLNLNTEAIRLQTTMAVSQQLSDGELQYMGESTHVAHTKALLQPSTLTDAEVSQVWAYLNVVVNATLSHWRAYKAGLTTAEDWKQSLRMFNAYISFRFGLMYWEMMKANLPASFVKDVEAEMATMDPDGLHLAYRALLDRLKDGAVPPTAPGQ